jgi:hypothetical protein
MGTSKNDRVKRSMGIDELTVESRFMDQRGRQFAAAAAVENADKGRKLKLWYKAAMSLAFAAMYAAEAADLQGDEDTMNDQLRSHYEAKGFADSVMAHLRGVPNGD